MFETKQFTELLLIPEDNMKKMNPLTTIKDHFSEKYLGKNVKQ